ncbi:hypothetical protein K7X08_021560 [Anisodus acutangulus]|uniref:Uncharacterized protein n=1 Tax=Anisodus acutangulus TaxID=402998 RepID=A0A9Q1REH3_9SOLA|nr:hypothetical protein K7X08_021560 [Anisodus acutangulus]
MIQRCDSHRRMHPSIAKLPAYVKARKNSKAILDQISQLTCGPELQCTAQKQRTNMHTMASENSSGYQRANPNSDLNLAFWFQLPPIFFNHGLFDALML